MNLTIRKFESKDTKDACAIWNRVVEDGVAFPQTDCLDLEEGEAFFNGQTYTGIAVNEDTGEIVGLYILHPNNIGRCGHIANASYAVKSGLRGHHIGEALVLDCLKMGKEAGFKIMQFNAVVASNAPALALYKKVGFKQLGTIPGGFHMKDGSYEDIILHYIEL